MAEDYGFKYSIPEKDLSKKDPNDVGFSSSFNTLKTYISGNISKAAPTGGDTTIEIPHGLGYIPSFNGYFKGGNGAAGEWHPISSGIEDVNNTVGMKADSYNLTITITNWSGSTKNIDIFYEIFYENIQEEPRFVNPF